MFFGGKKVKKYNFDWFGNTESTWTSVMTTPKSKSKSISYNFDLYGTPMSKSNKKVSSFDRFMNRSKSKSSSKAKSSSKSLGVKRLFRERKTRKCGTGNERHHDKCVKKCATNKVRHDSTGKCVKKCDEGYHRVPNTLKCRKDCKKGYSRNPHTKRCKKD